ncbi:hypothetical protein CFIMG_007905RA00001 [Ceratocystis fimbriata CBS 114723]|nr:hypothetical protein CFIMG_007905RA00001 [Ceratocystis fimbriata CBS 114723]
MGLPDNLQEIPYFEVPYDLRLLDTVETAEDLANLPYVITYEYGNMKAIPAWQRFDSRFSESVETSTFIDSLDAFKPGADFATEERQTSTTFRTMIRPTLNSSPEISKG